MNTKEEAIAKGIPLSPRSNDMHRRAPWHDYSRPGIYMLTLVTFNRSRLLGRLVVAETARIEFSPLGKAIAENEVQKIHQVYSNVIVRNTCIMPDHIHLIVEVVSDFAEKKHLGSVVAGFKSGCNKAYRALLGTKEGTMFNPKYNDRIIMPDMDPGVWEQYLADNPRRLAIKQMYPELFTTRYAFDVCNRKCNAIGNIFLLDYPDKMSVVVHRRDSEEEYKQKYDAWMACGERGGVLVSAGIAPREKDVLNEARKRGYSIIELHQSGFSPYYKPSGNAFEACAEGLLLQLSPSEYRAERRTISRSECLTLNALAEDIVRFKRQ